MGRAKVAQLADAQERQVRGLGRAFTGPKGVLADHQFHRQREQARQAERLQQQQDALDSHALRSGWIERQRVVEDAARFGSTASRGGGMAGADDQGPAGVDKTEEEGEEDELTTWRARRRRELQLQAHPRGPRFGYLEHLAPAAWVQRIDEPELAHTLALVHVAEVRMLACHRLGAVLEHLARRYPHVLCIETNNAALGPEGLDPVTLPALLAYRGGVLYASLFRVMEELDALAMDQGLDGEAAALLEHLAAHDVHME